jgi:outer membrane protein insertion porin family
MTGKAPFIPDRLDEDLNAVQLLYFTHGFRQTVITKDIQQNPVENTVRITIRIEEGPQTIVSDIRIEGLTAISRETALDTFQLQPGTPFRSYMLKSDRNQLSALIAEEGRPHVHIETEVSCHPDPSKAHLIYKVHEGPQVRFGRILITGNFRTRKSVIERELTIQPDTPFSLQAVLKSQQKLRDLAIFDTVSILPLGLKETRETVPLLVNVAEKKPYVIEVQAGFENYTGLFTQARLSDRNLLGRNKNAWFEAEFSQIGYRAESGLENPRFFGTPVMTAFSVYAEHKEEFNQNFGTRSFGGTMGFSWKPERRLSFGLNVELEQRDIFADDDAEPTADETDLIAEGVRSMLVLSPYVQYDTRDSFVRPRRGIFSELSMDISKGFNLSGDNFVRYELDNRFFVSPLPRLTLACLLRAGYIDAFGATENIPSDQRFFLGGATSVRGFEENLLRFDSNGDPRGGCSSISGSLEARMDLGNHFGMVLFYDVGRLGDRFQDLYSGTFRDTCGLGLHYITPVGPIGLSYGYNLDRMEAESPGEWYLSVGYTF